jgi:hypothetical protein
MRRGCVMRTEAPGDRIPKEFFVDKGPKDRYSSFLVSGGNNSVVECNLAKVEVAGSNPVSRSNPQLMPIR